MGPTITISISIRILDYLMPNGFLLKGEDKKPNGIR